jgi:hypothetical protein
MDWSPVCTTTLNRLKETYTLDSLEPFFSLGPEDTLHTTEMNMFDKEMPILDKASGEPIAGIWLEATPEEVSIELISRYSKHHKGVIRHILYLIICKAIQLNRPISFLASPNCKDSFSHLFSELNQCDKLYTYYNTIGFTRKRAHEHSATSQPYFTNVNTLKKIIHSWNPNSKGGRRTRRKPSKYLPIKECHRRLHRAPSRQTRARR